MDRLKEEILDAKREGEIILCMDGNAKVGLMGELMSRNGRLMTQMFEECEIIVMNGTK